MQIVDPAGFFAAFPRLVPGAVAVTSHPDHRYNCIAWAAGDGRRWWWPRRFAYWPPTAPRVETVEAFAAAFATLGYARVADGAFEVGTEKVAIYVSSSGEPTHAARQLTNGRWTSKVGNNVDLEHDLDDLVGPAYGVVGVFLGRAAAVHQPGAAPVAGDVDPSPDAAR